MVTIPKLRIAARLLVVLCTCLAPFRAHSENISYLWIRFQSGAVLSINLDDGPNISFNDETVEFGNLSFNIDDIKGYTFGKDEYTAVENVGGEPSVSFIGANKISIAGGGTGRITLANVAGVPYPVDFSEKDERRCVIDISSLPAGVYVLSASRQTIKFRKR